MVKLVKAEDDIGDKRTVTDYLDAMCEERIKDCPNVIVPWLLMASYLYYRYDFSILSDGFFDKLCNTMMYNYGEIKHRHKRLITPNDLAMGSLFGLMENDYPSITKDAALTLVYDHYGVVLRDGSHFLVFDDGTEYFVP